MSFHPKVIELWAYWLMGRVEKSMVVGITDSFGNLLSFMTMTKKSI